MKKRDQRDRLTFEIQRTENDYLLKYREQRAITFRNTDN